VAVSPTGDTVFVTGYSEEAGGAPGSGMIAYDYATIAHNG
jgi:hypothetical protein